MAFELITALTAAGLFLGMLLFSEIGRRIGLARLLAADAQPELRELFRRYLDLRSTVYQTAPDQAATVARLAEGESLQREIWLKALAAARRPEVLPPATMLVGQGVSLSKARRFYPVIFSAILSMTVFAIVDIEYPRLGLIRVDAADQVLVDLRKSMQ